MNIETTSVKNLSEQNSGQVKPQSQNDSQVKFADELKDLKKEEKASENNSKEAEKQDKNLQETKASDKKESVTGDKKTDSDEKQDNTDVNSLQFANKAQAEINNAFKGLNDVFNELNQKDEKNAFDLKQRKNLADIENKGDKLINNEFNINENKEILPQMNPNMNFGSDGQPFSSFMNNSGQHNGQPGSTAKDLAEEAQILSTMAENIAMANKLNIEEPLEKTVIKNDGIKKIDTQSGITKETIVKFDSVIMNEADVEVFVNLVNGEADMHNLAPEAAQRSVNVSKTLADMLAKAMEDNKPIRIDFDNNISVIIKIFSPVISGGRSIS